MQENKFRDQLLCVHIPHLPHSIIPSLQTNAEPVGAWAVSKEADVEENGESTLVII